MWCTSENVDDTRRYYEKTFILYENEWWTIYSVSFDYISLKNKEGTLKVLKYPFHLNFVLPGKQITETDDSVSVWLRAPEKQYHRGVSKGNSALFIYNNLQINTTPVAFNTLKPFLNPPVETRSLEKLEELFLNKKIQARVLNDALWMSRSGCLFCYFSPIGLINLKAKTARVAPSYKTFMSSLYPSLRVS